MQVTPLIREKAQMLWVSAVKLDQNLSLNIWKPFNIRESRGWQTFSVKGQIADVLGFAGSMDCTRAAELGRRIRRAATDDVPQLGTACANETLCTLKFEFCITSACHKNCTSFDIYFIF